MSKHILTPDQESQICHRMEMTGRYVNVVNQLALEYSVSNPTIYRTYRHCRGYRWSDRDRVTLETILMYVPFEPFDESGWEGFGMYVLE